MKQRFSALRVVLASSLVVPSTLALPQSVHAVPPATNTWSAPASSSWSSGATAQWAPAANASADPVLGESLTGVPRGLHDPGYTAGNLTGVFLPGAGTGPGAMNGATAFGDLSNSVPNQKAGVAAQGATSRWTEPVHGIPVFQEMFIQMNSPQAQFLGGNLGSLAGASAAAIRLTEPSVAEGVTSQLSLGAAGIGNMMTRVNTFLSNVARNAASGQFVADAFNRCMGASRGQGRGWGASSALCMPGGDSSSVGGIVNGVLNTVGAVAGVAGSVGGLTNSVGSIFREGQATADPQLSAAAPMQANAKSGSFDMSGINNILGAANSVTSLANSVGGVANTASGLVSSVSATAGGIKGVFDLFTNSGHTLSSVFPATRTLSGYLGTLTNKFSSTGAFAMNAISQVQGILGRKSLEKGITSNAAAPIQATWDKYVGPTQFDTVSANAPTTTASGKSFYKATDAVSPEGAITAPSTNIMVTYTAANAQANLAEIERARWDDMLRAVYEVCQKENGQGGALAFNASPGLGGFTNRYTGASNGAPRTGTADFWTQEPMRTSLANLQVVSPADLRAIWFFARQTVQSMDSAEVTYQYACDQWFAPTGPYAYGCVFPESGNGGAAAPCSGSSDVALSHAFINDMKTIVKRVSYSQYQGILMSLKTWATSAVPPTSGVRDMINNQVAGVAGTTDIPLAMRDNASALEAHMKRVRDRALDESNSGAIIGDIVGDGGRGVTAGLHS